MNIEEIDKWLDNEYGVSYTELEKLHDFVVDRDREHQKQKDKTINDLLKRISNLEFDVEEKDRRIDKAIEYMQEALECGYHGADLTFDKLVNNTTDILKGSDKE